MGFDTGLADRIRRKGVRVVEVAGWKTRGSSSFSPKGSINHHTAVGGGPTSALGAVTNGRSTPTPVPGPLANVFQSREADPSQDIAYVVAAGKANHGGAGFWKDMSGNSQSYGLEINHAGTSPVNPARLEIAARIHAAFIEGTPRKDASYTCQHFEYATPKGRKIDFYNLAPFTVHTFRQRVAYWVGRTASGGSTGTGVTIPAKDYVLGMGDVGAPVAELQRLLKLVYGSLSAIDGNFGAATNHLVVSFQKRSGLEADGVVGPKTWAALYAFEKAKTAESKPTPKPTKPVTLPAKTETDEKSMYLIKRSDGTAMYLTDFITKRRITAHERDVIAYVTAANGNPIKTAKDYQPIELEPDVVIAIPTVAVPRATK